MKEFHEFLLSDPDNFIIDPETFNLVVRLGEEEIILEILWASDLKKTFVKLVVLEIVLAMRKKREEIVPFADKSWKESASHDRPEITLKVEEEEMEEIKERMDEGIRKRDIPNLNFLSGRDKSIINKSRFGMLSMLLPMDRQKAKVDFMLHWGYCIPKAIDTENHDAKEERKYELF